MLRLLLSLGGRRTTASRLLSVDSLDKLIAPKLPRVALVQLRRESKFADLRKLTGQKDVAAKLIRTEIVLPKLYDVDNELQCKYSAGGSVNKPDATIFERCYLSPQRVDIVRSARDNLAAGRRGLGVILSGPNGAGKSSEAYLLAAQAFVTGHCVLYVPRCGVWLDALGTHWADANLRKRWSLRRLFNLNADLLEEMRITEDMLPAECRRQLKDVQNAAQLVLDVIEDEAHFKFAHDVEMFLHRTFLPGQLTQQVDVNGQVVKEKDGSVQRKPTCLFRIYDEVNSLFTPTQTHAAVDSVPAKDAFKEIVSWSSAALPKYSYKVTAGSGNSQHEMWPILESGHTGRICYLQPFPVEQAVLKLADFAPLKASAAGKQLSVDQVAELTGFFPRYLRLLHEQDTVAEYEKQLNDHLMQRMFVKGAFDTTFLLRFFGLRAGEALARFSAPAFYYDRGIVYVDEDNRLRPVNDAAHATLWQEAVSVIEPSLQSVDRNNPGSWDRFEENVKFMLATNKSSITLTSASDFKSTERLCLSAPVVQPFGLTGEEAARKLSIKPNQSGNYMLFLPQISNYRGLDLVLVGPQVPAGKEHEREIILVGISLDSLNAHEGSDDKLRKACDPAKFDARWVMRDAGPQQRSQVAQLMDLVTGVHGHYVSISGPRDASELKFTFNKQPMPKVTFVHVCYDDSVEEQRGKTGGFKNAWLVDKSSLAIAGCKLEV